MSMNTYLKGRLRNTPLPYSHGLLPLFEAVVNSIHSTAELNPDPRYGTISVDIIRSPQSSLQFNEAKAKRGASPLENIVGFRVTDNGIGFNDKNMGSFETLDTDYKAQYGCRGVGRLLWLKAFDNVLVVSNYTDDDMASKKRTFMFTELQGVTNNTLEDGPHGAKPTTCLHLEGFKKHYQERSAKSAATIATNLFEHCLWYFVRPGGAPKIHINDNGQVISLDDVYDTYMFSSAKNDSIKLKGNDFELIHVKLKASSVKTPLIAWCAASRVVKEENISGKVVGLHGKIRDEEGDFVYACYVTSPFLDEHVRSGRFGFDIEEMSDDLFSATDLSLSEIRNAVLSRSSKHLEKYLEENKKSGRERVEKFVAQRAPRYRPILSRISDDELSIDPGISDKDLDLMLHKQLSEIEGQLLSKGHHIMAAGKDEDPEDYNNRLGSYLKIVDDIKKSDLANYVFHRKVIIDILEKSIQRQEDGKYAQEELIHSLIMPLRKTSNEISLDSCNLWLLDERLAFHDFLASDKTLSSMPITGSKQTKEPDICALNVFDEPVLINDNQQLPLASIVVVEIKRPMRNDAKAGEDKDPVEQALGYLKRVRKGGTFTASGRPIPKSEDIPGFCYVICDITGSVKDRCEMLGLTVTSDHLGYFGYNPNLKAYIEVISFDRLVKAAKERNRAFFDKLGLPAN